MKIIIQLMTVFFIIIQCGFSHPFPGINKNESTIFEKKTEKAESEKLLFEQTNPKSTNSKQSSTANDQPKHHHPHEKSDMYEKESKNQKNIISDARVIYCVDKLCEIITDIMIMKENFNCKEKFLKIKFFWQSDSTFKNVLLTPNCGIISEKQEVNEHCPLIRRYGVFF